MRKFQVWTYSSNSTGRVTKYTVGDCNDEESKFEQKNNTVVRPDVAEFPVSQLHAADEQKHRAYILKDYLNKIEEAKQQAVEQTALVDLLSAAIPTVPQP